MDWIIACRHRRSCGLAIARATGFPVAAHVEAQIEQGPVLEAAGAVIGVVTGIQGASATSSR